MLHENLKRLRTARGLTQDMLAQRLHVVRQTISKWEKGLSVPDAQLLLRLAEELDTTVAALLDESVPEEAPVTLPEVAAQLSALNAQYAQQAEQRRKRWRLVFILLGVVALGTLLYRLAVAIWVHVIMMPSEGTEAIIGGADGPTAIFVTSQFAPSVALLLCIALVVIAGVGIWKTRRQ